LLIRVLSSQFVHGLTGSLFLARCLGIKCCPIQHLVATQSDVAEQAIMKLEKLSAPERIVTRARQAHDQPPERQLSLSEVSRS
jgi:hypothetical protein